MKNLYTFVKAGQVGQEEIIGAIKIRGTIYIRLTLRLELSMAKPLYLFYDRTVGLVGRFHLGSIYLAK